MSGPLGSQQWMYNAGGSFYPYSIDQSLRVPNTDSGTGNAYLNRTPASASNRKTWTYSAWVKRSKLGDGGANQSQLIWAAFDGGDADQFQFGDTNNLRFYLNDATNANIQTTAVYSDVSSWYHIVLAVDTTQATAADRVKIYVNGEEVTDFSTSTYPTQNYDTDWNNNVAHTIGQSARINSTQFFCGYMAEIHFIDGTALDATSFGETINGIWVPKNVSGLTYGTNGFYLSFADSAAIGDDLSGNTNDFTANNLAASDVMSGESPTNNFCTFNALMHRAGSAPVLSEGNLTAVWSGYWFGSTFGITSGKWYWEYVITAGTVGSEIGIASADRNFSGGLSNSSVGTAYGYKTNGQKFENTTYSSYGASWTTGDIIGIAFDYDSGTLTFYKNNSSQGTAFTGIGADTWIPAFANSTGSSMTARVNFGQDSSFAGTQTAQGNTDANGIGDFYYSPPSGFLALCSANLDEPTIGPNSDTTSDEHFNTVLYTGTGATQSITGVGFQPDWTWIKARSAARSNVLYDSVRGVTKQLISNLTNAESTASTSLTSFDSDGFSIGTSGAINTSSDTLVAWNWKAGGTAVSNTDGSITSSVSANQDAGFSIVSYTGTGANATVGHGLSSAPEMLIIKTRDSADNWPVYHAYNTSQPETDRLLLSTSDVTFDNATMFNDTAPTSSVFSVGTNVSTNKSGDNFICYAFHSVDGHLKCGSYIGNGSTDGTFVYTGFRPAWVMHKTADTTANHWSIRDNKRDPDNEVLLALYANLANADDTGGDAIAIDFLSNGFKARRTNSQLNQSGVSYIYLAFAEAPFKYANAR